MMLDSRSDQVSPLFFQEPSRAEDGQVGAFRTAAGKDHLARLAAKNSRSAVPGIVQQRSRPAPDVVHTGRVSPDIAQERQHGLTHLGIQRGRRVVIEVDGSHFDRLKAIPVGVHPFWQTGLHSSPRRIAKEQKENFTKM